MAKNTTFSEYQPGSTDPNDNFRQCPDQQNLFNLTAQRSLSLFNVPFSLVMLRRRSGVRVAARAGRLSSVETQAGRQLCALVMQENQAIVFDTMRKSRQFGAYRWLLEKQRIRFFVGYPIGGANGDVVGAIALMDRRERLFSNDDFSTLDIVAQRLEEHVELWMPTDANFALPPVVSRQAINLVPTDSDEDICILVIDIDIPITIVGKLGSMTMEDLEDRIHEQIRVLVRDYDAVTRTPYGHVLVFIRGGEKAAQQVAQRISDFLGGWQIGAIHDDGQEPGP